MKNSYFRLAFFFFFLLTLVPFAARAQYTTATVNGTIGASEYGTHTDGSNQNTNSGVVTYMTWDATNLYVGVSGSTVGEAIVLYLDKDPQVPVNGGTNANGTNVGFNYDGANFAALQFRADLVLYAKNGYREYRTADGSNGWSTSGTTGWGSYSDNSTFTASGVQELALPWSAVGGIPASFNFFVYKTSSAGFVYGQQPTANSPVGSIGTTARWQRYYTVTSTTNGSATKPFSRDCYVFNSTSNITGFGAISVWDFTMNSSGLSLTRTTGAGGAWTISGSLVVGNGTVDFGSSSNTATVGSSSGAGGTTFGGVNMSGGALTLSTASGGDLNLNGNFIKTGGTFTANSRQVAFTGNSKQRWNSSATESQNIYIANSNTTDSVRLETSITNTLAAGTISLSASTKTVLCGGATWTTGSTGAITTAGAFQILPGASFVSATSGTHTFTSGVMTVNGTYRRSVSNTMTGLTTTTLVIGATGTYDHNMDAGTIPAPTWTAGTPGATCLVSGWVGTTSPPTGLTQTYQNFTWNSTGMTATLNLNGGLLAVNGKFTATSTGSGNLRLTGSTGVTMNFGSLSQTGGTLYVTTTGTQTLNISGTAGVSLTGGTFGNSGAGASTIVFNGASATTQSLYLSGVTIPATGTVNWNVGNASNTNTVQLITGNSSLGSASGTFTVTNNATMDFQTFVLSGTAAFTANASSILKSANTNAGGAFATGSAGSVQVSGTRTYNAGHSLILNGSGTAQSVGTVVGGGTTPSLGTLTISNSTGVSLAAATTITGLTFTAGTLDIGANNLTFLTGTTTGASTTSYVKTSSTGLLRRTVAGSAVSFPVGNSSYNPLTLTNTGTSDTYGVAVVDAAHPNANSSALVINRYWSITESVAGGSTLNPVVAQYNGSDPRGASFNSGSTNYVGLYTSSWTQQTATLGGSDPFTFTTGVALSPGSNASYALAIGRDAAFVIPPTSYTWVGGISNDWTNPANWNPNTSVAGPTSSDNVIISSGGSPFPLIVAANQTVIDFTLGASGTFSTNSGVNLTITGNVSYTAGGTASLDPASTVTISNAGSQTIPPLNYGSLNASGGARTFTSGATTGIAGTLTPGSSNTLTGSTINFNGTGAQTINALNYNNLTISGARISLPTLTLASGTIGIAGTLSYTATGFAAVTSTGNTVDYNGTGSQTIGAFSGYNNLTISGARGTATLTLASGTMGVAGTFNPSATGTLTWVNTGNAIDFNSAGAQTIPVFGFYNDIQNTGNGNRTLANGTIGIAGTYTPTSGTVTIGTSTIDFTSASSQAIPATSYYNITNSGNGDRVWANSGNIDIGNAFTPGSGTHTITGSTVRYVSAVSGTYTLTGFTTNAAPAHYNNLVISAVGSTFNLASGLTLRTVGDFTMSGGTLNLNPNAATGGLTVGGNLTHSGGAINVNTSTNTGTLSVTGNAALSSTLVVATTGTGNFNVGGSVTQTGGTVIISNGAGTAGGTTTGNWSQSAGTLRMIGNASSPNTTYTISGNYALSGTGVLQMESTSSTSGASTLIIGGDATFTSTSASMIDFGTGTVTGNEVRIAGNFSKSGTGTFTTTAAGSPTGFTFNKAGTQTFSYAGSSSNFTQYTVNSGSTLQFITANQAPFGISTSNPISQFNVLTGGTLDMQGFTLDAGNSLTTFTLNSGATLKTGIAGGVTAALTNFGAGKRTFNAAANYEFNGTVTQSTGFNTPGITAVNNLTINNTGGTTGVTLDNSPTVTGALSFSNGLLTLGSNTLTLGSSATTSGAGAGKYVDAGSTGLLTRSSIATAASGAFPIGASGYYLPLTITNQGTATSFSARVKQPQATGTVADNTQIVNAEWAINSSSTNADVSFGWPSGAQGGSFNPAGTMEVGRFSGVTAYNLVASGLSATGSNPYALAVTGVTSFATAAPFVIGNSNAVVAPFTSYTWNGSTSSDWATAANWTPNGVPGAVDNVTINAQTPDIPNNLVITSNRSVTDFSLDNSDASGQPGTFTLNAGVSLTVAGNVTYGGSATATLDPTSTVLISNASSQPVPPLTYGNLNASGGARVFTSGATTGIAGTLTPGSSNTLTGSTINFSGSGAQTINALSYNNLTISNGRSGAAITLASGTIDVAGTFDISTLSSYTATVTGNTFNFSGAAGQTIPAFFYNNLSSSNANRTLASSGTIDVAGSFTPGTGTYTITGSTFRYSAASGSITLPSFTSGVASRQYNNLILAGGANYTQAASYNLGVVGDLTFSGTGSYTVCANTSANTLTVDGNLIHSGSGNVVGTSSSGAATVSITGNVTVNGGGILRIANGTAAAGSATFTVTGNTTVSSGTLNMLGSASVASVTSAYTTNNFTLSGTGTVQMELSSTTASSALNVNDLTITSTATPAIDLGAGTNNGTTTTNGNVITILGNFNKSGTGTLSFSGTYATFSGYYFNKAGAQTWDYTGANMTGGNFTVGAGSTLTLNTGVVLGSGGSSLFLVTGRLYMGNNTITTGNVANSFSSSSGIIRTNLAGGISAAISGFNNALTLWTSPTTFEYTGTNVNTGLSAYGNISSTASHVITWLGSGTLTLDKAMTVSTLNFTNNGLFYLGTNNLTLASGGTLNGAPFSSSKMIVTDNTGQFIRNFTTAGISSATLWPIGDGTVYAPVTINTLTIPLTAGTMGFRTVASAAPNYAPATIYLNRYWRPSITGPASYSWTGTFGYATSDIVPNAGSEGSLKLDIFDYSTSGWTEYASSSASGGVLTVTAGPSTGSLAATDITGRLDVPIYYRTAGAGPATWSTAATWEISSDPTFVSPAPTTATIAPNATNSAGITVRSGHTVNITGSAVSADQMTIEATGVVNANSAALNIANGTGTDLTVNGTLNVGSAATWATGCVVAVPAGGYVKSTAGISSLATVTVDGTYEHAINGGTIPTATWADSSYVIISSTTLSTAISGLTSQSFGNFQVNAPSMTGSPNFLMGAGTTLTIRGNFRITSTGSATSLTPSNNAVSVSVGGSFIVDGGVFDLNRGATLITYTIGNKLRQSGGTITRTSAGNSALLTVGGSLIQTGGDFAYSAASGSTTMDLSGDLYIAGTSFSRSSGTATINFKRTSGNQVWTQTTNLTGAFTINIGNGSTTNEVQLASNVAIPNSTNSNVIVFTGATLNFFDYVLSGTTNGTFNANSGSTLKMGSAYGITTATTGATGGNVQMPTRTYNQGAKYTYTGTVNQATGNGLPTTLTTGQITIANTGSSGNNTVTLTTSGSTTPTLNLTSGLFAIGTGQTLTIANSGTVNATGGDFATGSTGGTVNVGSGSSVAFNGSFSPYNVTTAGGLNFGAGTVTIQNGGTFQINNGGFVNTNAPFYASGATLKYNVNAVYGRDLEWSASSGRGYPHHVQLSNNTTLNPANTGASKAAVAFRTGGDVTIDAGSSLYMDYSGNNMTVPLVIGANLNLTGSLSGSASSGGNILIGGNWTNNGTGTNFFPNLRGVIFNGASAQTIGGTNTTVPAFDSLSIRNTSGDVTTNLPLKVSRRLRLQSGKLFLGSNTVSVTSTGFTQWDSDSASYVVTNGTGVLKQFIATSGNRFYPVGPDGSGFAPVTLTQGGGGTSDSISVLVKNAPAYTNAVNDNTQMVEFEWTITEGNAGGNSLTTNFGWEGSGEATNFDRTAGVFHANYTGSNYALRATNSTTGTNPYFSSSISASPYTGNLSGMRFVVGNINGIVPCIQSAAAGDWNTGTNWVGGLVPPLSSNVCLNHAMTLGANPANPTTVTFNAGAGLNISSGIVLTLEPSASFTNASGSPITLGGSGAVSFSGLAAVNGANAFTFPYLKISGNTNFTTVPTIADSLEINAGGFILTGGVTYGGSSTLVYNTGGSYGRNTEWSATSGNNFPNNVRVRGGTTLDISNGSNTARVIAGSFAINSGSTATMSAMTGNLTVPGNFTLNGTYTQSTSSGGDLVLGGNWSSGSSAVLNPNNRDVSFNGSTTQTITNAASGLAFGFLTIDNTAGGVDLQSVITVNTFRVNATRTFNLNADKFIVAAGGNVLINGTFNANSGTIEYTNGGNFTNNGTFNRGTSTLDFIGASAGNIVGSVQTNFHNIRLFPGGGIDFGSGALRGRISGTFQLRAGSYVTGNAPIYEAGSKLQYAGGGTFNRNLEWDNTYVQKVELTNNTALYVAGGGNTNAGYPATMADSLIIQSGSTFDMSNMTASANVGGNLLLAGTLTLSGNSGSDLNVGGDWVNNSGTFTSNDRLVTFNGSSNAAIKGSSTTTFPFITVDKGVNATLTPQVPFTLSRAGGATLRVAGGILNLNGISYTLGGGSNTLRIDSGFAKQQTLRTGGSSISGFTTYRRGNLTADSLGGKVDFSGGSSETLLALGYNLLSVTGGTTATVNQNTRVADSLIVGTGSTLTFGAGSLKVITRGNILNQGTVTSTNSGQVILAGGSTQNMAGSGNYGNLVMNNNANANLSGKPTVTNSLQVLLGKIITGSSDTLILGSAATVTETISGPNEHFVRGNFKTVRTVGTSAETFGGMGVELAAGSNLGTVTVVRTSGSSVTGSGVCCTGHSSINRRWKVEPSVQPAAPDRQLKLYWPSQDDNSQNMVLLQLWKSPDGIVPYNKIGNVQNVSVSNPRMAVLNNLPSFSVFTGADDVNPLPLGLLRFAGANVKGIAQLNWTMTNEKNWSGFSVERSMDGKNFAPIGYVASLNNGRATNAYRFADNNLTQNSYYRLRLLSPDGTHDYSETVFISVDGGVKRSIRLFPNPAAAGAEIAINGLTDLSESVQVEVYGLDGRPVITLEGILSDVNGDLAARVQALPAGMYQVKVSTTEQVQTLRLIKQ